MEDDKEMGTGRQTHICRLYVVWDATYCVLRQLGHLVVIDSSESVAGDMVWRQQQWFYFQVPTQGRHDSSNEEDKRLVRVQKISDICW